MKLEALMQAFPHPVGPLRILVVDDQPLNIRALHEVFRGSFEVLMAKSGEQALAVCRLESPDIILLDVLMPGMSGHEVCRRLKADPTTRDIPIIFITSQDQEDDEALGFEIGAVDFIRKPIQPVTVLARVRTHLALKLQSDLLRSMALVDGLTGIANRRRFDEELTACWNICLRLGTPLSLMLLDLDYFKQFNDRYGHLAGDSCLTRVANALKSCLHRPGDILARYGGEEFACLLPHTDPSGAMNRAELMRQGVHDLFIDHDGSTVSRHVTISIGVATLVPNGETVPAALLDAADKQLYVAKENGRDRACIIGMS